MASKKTTSPAKKSTPSVKGATKKPKVEAQTKRVAKKAPPKKSIVKKTTASKPTIKKAAPKKVVSKKSTPVIKKVNDGPVNGTKKVVPFQMMTTKTMTTPVMQLIANVTKTSTSISVHKNVRSDRG